MASAKYVVPELLVCGPGARRVGDSFPRYVVERCREVCHGLWSRADLRVLLLPGGDVVREVPAVPAELEVRIPVGVRKHVRKDVQRLPTGHRGKFETDLLDGLDDERVLNRYRRLCHEAVDANTQIVAPSTESPCVFEVSFRQMRHWTGAIGVVLRNAGFAGRRCGAVVGLAQPCQALRRGNSIGAYCEHGELDSRAEFRNDGPQGVAS